MASRCYGLPAYFISKNIFEFPLMLLFPLLTQLITYWGAPYNYFNNDTWTFAKFYIVLFFVAQCAVGCGYCISAACKNQVDASTASNIVNLPALFFSGFFSSNQAKVAKSVMWIQWINPVRYAFEALLRAEYDQTHFLTH